MLEAIGYIGGLLLAGCAIPQVYESYKKGNAEGVSSGLLWMWWIGEYFMLAYFLIKHGWDGPVLLNYVFNIILVGIIMKYKYFPRQSN